MIKRFRNSTGLLSTSSRVVMQRVVAVVSVMTLTIRLSVDQPNTRAEIQQVNMYRSYIERGGERRETETGGVDLVEDRKNDVNSNTKTGMVIQNRVLRSSTTDSEQLDKLIIQTVSGLKYVTLNKHRMAVDLPFAAYSASLCVKSSEFKNVTINSLLTSTVNYTLGLGENLVDIGVSTSAPSLRMATEKHYIIGLNRQLRVERQNYSKTTQVCFLEQDCDLVIYAQRPCGLQPLQTPSNASNIGWWRVECGSCSDESSCEWHEAQWMEPHLQHPAFAHSDKKLRRCLTDKKVLFLGDSTNRGLMQSLMEQVNKTLHEAVKSHNYISYANLGYGTNFSFMYYPAFWMKERMTFVQTLHNLTARSAIPRGEDNTFMVVGGVQWLTKWQLLEIKRFTDRNGIAAGNVVIKSHSSGFHVNVTGIPYLHSKISLQKLLTNNDKLVSLARKYGFRVVDTLQMTLSRYKEFLQGKCACHFHKVTEQVLSLRHPHNVSDVNGAGEKQVLAIEHLYDLGLVENSQTVYHISGDIHNAYKNMMVRELCSGLRN